MTALTTFRGYLKQLALAELTASERTLLDAWFPEFRRADTMRDALRQLGDKVRVSANNAVPVGFGRLRRFAGGPSLGPGRYSSVAYDETGRDNGTLISELMGYWQPLTGWVTDVRDAGWEVANDDGSTQQIRVLEIFADHYELKGLIRRGPSRTRTGRQAFMLRIERAEIDRVVDLRLPETQAWFSEQFISLEQEFALRGHTIGAGDDVVTLTTQPIHDFVELLPTLVMNDIGGGTFHQAVGAWLRNNGVNGLVYPSARRNAMVTWEGNRCIFDGWNFVDFRDGGRPANHEELFGWQPRWLRPEDVSIQIERRREFPGWAIHGAEQRDYERFLSHLRDFPPDAVESLRQRRALQSTERLGA